MKGGSCSSRGFRKWRSQGPEVAVASVCLIAVLYNYEQWRDRARVGEWSAGERTGEAWRRAEASRMPCEMHTPGEIDGDALGENETAPRQIDGEGEGRPTEMVNERG